MKNLDYQNISDLVKRARNGDSDSFAKLYAATYQKEYRFAYNYLKDEHLAQDALQETYIQAFKNLCTLKNTKLFISWLNQINFRVCFNMHEKQKRYVKELSDYEEHDIHLYLKRHHKHPDTPEDQIVKVDECEYIMKKILNLPFLESEAIILKYYENMKLEEIANVMDVSRSTVKRYLRRGRHKLRQLLKL